jgi:hypothetical protein
MLEIRELRDKFKSKREEAIGGYMMRSVIDCTAHRPSFG